MEGGELFNRISSRETNPYTEGDAKRYLLMIVKAVQHLHSINIVFQYRSLYLHLVFFFFRLIVCYSNQIEMKIIFFFV